MSEVLRPSTVCGFLRTEPLYQQQRDRLGALLHEGFAYYDKYQKARPYMLYGGAGLAAVGAFMWYWRGIRKGKRGFRVTEAHAIYPAMVAAGAGLMWLGKPDNPNKPRPTDSAAGGGFPAWLDTKVDALRKQDPRFADKQIQRAINAYPAVWNETPDFAKTFVTCGRS